MSDTENFTNWLNQKLRKLNTDETVFGSYILGIVEGDDSVDDKREALEGVLAAIIENDIEAVISEIIEQWEKCRPKEDSAAKQIEDVDTKLAKLLENKHITTTVQRQYTPEELRIREQILSQYSTVEFDDGYEEDGDDGGGSVGASVAAATSSTNDPFMVKNTNAQDVAQLAKERREQAKLESKAKKDKDKEDREKQKQLREEKKEKRKTVKGERRR